MEKFVESILESDKYYFDGAISRDSNLKVIKVGDFEVGKSASYTTPVQDKCSTIIGFDLPWAVFNSGRVEIIKLHGWVKNPLWDEWAEKIESDYQNDQKVQP